MKANADAHAPSSFAEFLKRLVRVPKREIDEQEEKYQKERAEQKNQPAKKRA